jgi:hypothetical protein
MFIKIISADRPEDESKYELPKYHELLNYLCDEFKIPGSPSFKEAVNFIKRKIINKDYDYFNRLKDE